MFPLTKHSNIPLIDEATVPYIASANNENYYSATNIMKSTKEATRSLEEKERKRQKGYHLEEEEPQSVLLPYTHPHDDGTYAKSIYDHKFAMEVSFITLQSLSSFNCFVILDRLLSSSLNQCLERFRKRLIHPVILH